MAGTLTISTLSDGTNSTSSTNCIQGSAKAWVNWNGSGGATIRASYNVSSVTRQGTGQYTVNFTNALSDANYITVCNASARDGSNDGNIGVAAPKRVSTGTYSTTAVQIDTSVVSVAATAGYFDCGYVGVAIFR